MTITALSEWHHANADHLRYLARLASLGGAQSCVELRVADAEDRAVPPSEAGEIRVRGDSVMRGYWQNPQATHEALHPTTLDLLINHVGSGDSGFAYVVNCSYHLRDANVG